MEQFILSFLLKSFVMTAIFLVVSALNTLFGKTFPAKLRYAVWLIVLVGLIIPLPPLINHGIFSFPLPVPGQQSQGIERPLETAMPELEPYSGQTGTGFTIQTQNPPPSALYNRFFNRIVNARFVSPFIICLFVWGFVAMVIFAWHIRQYFCFRRTVRRWGKTIQDSNTLSVFQAVQTEMGLNHKKISLIVCGFVTSSMLTGFLRPVILLPEKHFESDELEFIFRHELIHYKRRDLFIKLLTVIAVSIYWFNPLIYWLCEAIQADGEASCDEEVLQDSGKENRHFYAEIIIGMISEMSASPTVLSTSFFYRGKIAIKKRLDSIMDAALKPRWPAVLTLTAVMVLTLLSGSVFAFAVPSSAAVQTTALPVFDSSTRTGVITVAEALNLRDGAYVTMEGRIELFLGGENYQFSDGTGTITLEIDNRTWGNIILNEHDTVEISGEVEHDSGSIEVEVSSIRIVSESGLGLSGVIAGFSGPRAVITVAEALNLSDDAPVILVGRIESSLGRERYSFSDGSGAIVLEIDRETWGNLSVNEHDLVEISGEIDRDSRSTEVEVINIRKL